MYQQMPLTSSQPFRPGFLMAPLGWLTERLAACLKNDPELLTALFELDGYRMHALGLGLAHFNAGVLSRTMIEGLARRSPRTSLRQLLGRWPQGLDRALRALPDTNVLEPESYRALVTLLGDSTTAAHLHHCRSITEPVIIALTALPGPLRRPAVFKLLDEIDGMDRFVTGLEFLCDRAGIAFDSFVEELGSLDQPEQISATIVDLAEALPLPDRLPDLTVGSFRRLDNVVQIRAMARAWRNCLGDFLREINEGTTLVYHCIDDEKPAAAVVVRVHRLGWALVDIKGPKNVEIDDQALSTHRQAFRVAGIPTLADVAAIRSLLWQLRRRR